MMFRDYSELIEQLTAGNKGRKGQSGPLATTMVGSGRQQLLAEAVQTVVAESIPGDFVECGVWRGGSCILAKRIFDDLGVTNRHVWVCDSFEGLPRPNVEKYPLDKGSTHYRHDFLRVSVDDVKANFARFGCLDERVEFVKGFFSESMPRVTAEKIAILRLDGDIYESTIQPLDALWERLQPGGYLIVDDYAKPRVTAACDDFHKRIVATYSPIRVGKQMAWWRK